MVTIEPDPTPIPTITTRTHTLPTLMAMDITTPTLILHIIRHTTIRLPTTIQTITTGTIIITVLILLTTGVISYWQFSGAPSQAIPSWSASRLVHPQTFNWYCASAQEEICVHVLLQSQL